MQQYNSPVLDALKDWKSKEDARQSVLKKDMSNNRDFLKSRLAAYKRIYKDNRHLKDPAHKDDLRALRGQIKELNQALFTRRQRAMRAIWNLVKAPLVPLLRPLGKLAGEQYDRLKTALGDQLNRMLQRSRKGNELSAQELAAQIQADQKPASQPEVEQPLALMQRQQTNRILKLRSKGRGTGGQRMSG